jgi:hypothetical protein
MDASYRREDVAGSIVAHLASQAGVPREAYPEGEWSERTQRHQRAQIRASAMLAIPSR